MTDEIRTFSRERGVTKIALMRGDEELSRTLVVPMTMRFGRTTLRMDGIGDVATPEQHRHKGYSRRVMEAAVSFMTAGDAVLATLYGIPHFYPKYGFATLGPEFTVMPLELDERNTLPDGLTARDGRPGDLPVLRRLYHQETAHAYGPLVRDDDWWTWDVLQTGLQPDASEVKVVERDGVVVGYAFRATNCWWMEHWKKRDPEGLRIGEAFAADPEAAAAVLAACRQWAVAQDAPKVELAIPPASRVATAAMTQNAVVVARSSDQAEFMGRAIGLVAMLRAVKPELEARWRPVSCSMPEFAFTIVTDGERATISGNGSGIEIGAAGPGDLEIALDPGAVARLVCGSFEPEALAERLDLPSSAMPVVTTLFPKHVPYIYPVDRF